MVVVNDDGVGTAQSLEHARCAQHASSLARALQVLLGIRTNMLVGGARIDPHNHRYYHEVEAREAFNRMVREHGWY